MRNTLHPRTWLMLVALTVVMIGGMIRLGDPEPALPRCNSAATYHVRCRP